MDFNKMFNNNGTVLYLKYTDATTSYDDKKLYNQYI